MATPATADSSTSNDNCNSDSDEVRSSDFRSVSSCVSLQKEISDLFRKTKRAVSKKMFVDEIMPHLHNVEDLKGKLDQSIADLERIDCPIVFAGETSSGKSSIINAILGENILPTGITATTTRVCRIKPSENLMIITLDANYKELEVKPFSDTQEMADELEKLAQTNNPEIGYVDILMPDLYFQQENLAVVDTPGIGDSSQREVARKMMEYLPNALAFVFVINVPAAGGLQRDRIARILAHVKRSQNRMVSFSRQDVIFLLNKWDSLLKKDDKEGFFEKTKSHFRDLWADVDDNCILKMSMNTDFREHVTMLDKFKRRLNEVIVKNKEKRIKTNLRLLKSLLNKCTAVVSPKLKRARQNAQHSKNKLDGLLITIFKLEKIRREESLNIEENVKRFLDEVTRQFSRYIDDPILHANILEHVEKSWRLKIEVDIDTRIEIETKHWEKKHVQQIFQETIVQTLDKKLRRICQSETEYLMKGFRVPIDLHKKKSFGTFKTALTIAGGCALSACILKPEIAATIAAGGMAMAGAVRFGFLSKFKDVCKDALKERIHNLTKENIRKALDERYAKTIKNMMRNALDTMQTNINRMQEEGKKKQTKHTVHTSKLDTIMSLNTTISNIKERLQDIEEKIA